MRSFATTPTRLTVIGLAWAVAGAGCRSELKGKRGGGAPAEEAPVEEPAPEIPVDVPNGVGLTRTHVQSRNVVTLLLTDPLLEGGDRFTLRNATTRAAIIESQPIIPGAGLVEDEQGYAYRLVGPYELSIRLYPTEMLPASKLTYGDNAVELRVDDADAPDRAATGIVVLRDFTIFGSSGALFEENVQRDGGFQGWLSPTIAPSLSAPLTTGASSIINL